MPFWFGQQMQKQDPTLVEGRHVYFAIVESRLDKLGRRYSVYAVHVPRISHDLRDPQRQRSPGQDDSSRLYRLTLQAAAQLPPNTQVILEFKKRLLNVGYEQDFALLGGLTPRPNIELLQNKIRPYWRSGSGPALSDSALVDALARGLERYKECRPDCRLGLASTHFPPERSASVPPNSRRPQAQAPGTNSGNSATAMQNNSAETSAVIASQSGRRSAPGIHLVPAVSLPDPLHGRSNSAYATGFFSAKDTTRQRRPIRKG